jgi:hypothetical protein
MQLDGMSVSATERITGVYDGTILRLLTFAGDGCEKVCRIYKSLRITPAMAGGISDYAWDIGELLQ